MRRDESADETGAPLLRRERCSEVAFERLGERDQLVLTLTVTADPAIPYAEIARRLGCPVGSIGPTRQRALWRLQRMISNDVHDGAPVLRQPAGSRLVASCVA